LKALEVPSSRELQLEGGKEKQAYGSVGSLYLSVLL
jgi:hypothetical protein